MEEPVKEQPSSGNTATRTRLQKYALRSSTKLKEEKSDTPNCSDPSETKRVKTVSSVSKSVNVLDFSGNGKSSSAKPPRRLSIPAKASATSKPKISGNFTPISETRTGRSAFGEGRTKTPISGIAKTSSQMKLNLLTSASYWLNQIKLSEYAGNHSISLDFFRLALEAGCEPLGSMQEGLKSYVRRHQLDDLGETVKALFESYNISENMEQLQVSETISHVPEEGTQSYDDDVHNSSTMGTRKLKPKSLNNDSTQVTPSTESTKKETGQKSNPGSRLRRNLCTNTTTPRAAPHNRNDRLVKKSEKLSKQEPTKEKGMVKRQGRKSDVKEVTVSTPKENKENMDAQTNEEISVTEIVV